MEVQICQGQWLVNHITCDCTIAKDHLSDILQLLMTISYKG